MLKSHSPNQAHFNVVGNIGRQLFDSVIAEIQTLESALSLFVPLRQINWRYPEYEPVFEEGEGRSDLGALRVSRGKIAPQKIAKDAFVSIVGIGLKAQPLTVVASFWREGGQHPVQHLKQLATMLNVTTVPTVPVNPTPAGVSASPKFN